MELTNREWKEFFIGETFKIYSTSSGIDKNKLVNLDGDIPYITRTDKNNGYDMFIGKQNQKYKVDKKNVITIGLDTQTIFYQKSIFYTGQNIQILEFKELNEYNAKFLITLLKQQMTKFNWGGNGATLTRLKKTKILLPVNSHRKPDYAFMESYIQQKEIELLKVYKNHLLRLKPTEKVKAEIEWKEFVIGDIFKISSTSSSIDKVKLTGKQGLYPYITRTDRNNGYDLFVGEQPNYSTDKGNVITIGLDTQTVFYQKTKFYTGQNIQILEFDELNEHNAQFIIALLKIQMKKFSWGSNGATLTRLKKTKILLPITTDNKPDYIYMENYMKALEYEKLKQYLDYKNLINL